VPFLTGYNADESLGGPTTPAEFAAMVRARYGAFADRLLALYPHATAAEVQASVPLLARDRYMASLLLWSRARAAAQHSPVYDYLYDHPFPPGAGKPWGAFHTAEVPYIFGALRVKGRSFTAADQAVSRQLQSHWIAFMQSASPATPDLAWPPITPTSTNVMDLGDSAGPRPAVSSPQRLAVFTDFVASGGRLSLF
jgi:para-nitrobenzyl esterase